MWDFPFDKPNLVSSIIPLLMYVYVCGKWVSKLKYCGSNLIQKARNTNNSFWFILLILFVSCFSVDGDFFSFMEVVRNFTIGGYNYGEEVYHILTLFVNRNYFLFRLIVWGGALCIYAMAAYRFKLPVLKSVLYLFISFAVIFCYARVTLCMAICFLGLSFFCVPLKNSTILSYSLGLFFLYSSTFFHSSSYILIGICTMYLLPINKKTVFLFLIISPIVLQVAQDLFVELASMSDSFGNEGVAERLQRRASNVREGSLLNLNNPGVLLHTLLQYISFYLPIFVVSKVCLSIQESLPIYIRRLFRVFFSIFLASSVFFFFKIGGFTMYYRVLFMTMMPLSMLIIYLYDNNYMTKSQFKYCIYSGIAANFIRTLYGVYGYGL